MIFEFIAITSSAHSVPEKVSFLPIFFPGTKVFISILIYFHNSHCLVSISLIGESKQKKLIILAGN